MGNLAGRQVSRPEGRMEEGKIVTSTIIKAVVFVFTIFNLIYICR